MPKANTRPRSKMRGNPCTACGKPIDVHEGLGTCSPGCYNWRSAHRDAPLGSRPVLRELECPMCGTRFMQKRPTAQYCREKCREAARTRRTGRVAPSASYERFQTCAHCGKDIIGRKANVKYCSKACNHAAHYAANPGVYALRAKAQRPKTLGLERLELTVDRWQSIIHRQRSRCAYCDTLVPTGKETMDHVIPLIRGGRHAEGNLVMACSTCNSSKNGRLLADWRYRSMRGKKYLQCLT